MWELKTSEMIDYGLYFNRLPTLVEKGVFYNQSAGGFRYKKAHEREFVGRSSSIEAEDGWLR